MSSAHSPTLSSHHLRHSSFPILPLLQLGHSSFSNPSFASPTSQLILKPFRRFAYVTSTLFTSLDEPLFMVIIRVFFPKAGPSLQAKKPKPQFCRRQVLHRKLRNQGCSFTRDLIGAVASRRFPHPTLSLASEQTLKDLKRSQGHQRGEESGFG